MMYRKTAAVLLGSTTTRSNPQQLSIVRVDQLEAVGANTVV